MFVTRGPLAACAVACAAACGVDTRDAAVLSALPAASAGATAMGGASTLPAGGSGATDTGDLTAEMAAGGSGSTAPGGASATEAVGGGSSLERSEVGGEQPAETDGEPPVQQDEPIGGCFQQLLVNASFAGGHAGWTEVGTVRDVIVAADDPALVAASVEPQSGQYLAWLGGIPNGPYDRYQTTLTQEVAIPPETLSLTLSGYFWVEQAELGLDPSDYAVLELQDPRSRRATTGFGGSSSGTSSASPAAGCASRSS